MRDKVDIPALLTKAREIGDRRLAAGQDDEIGDRHRLAGTDEDEPHGGSMRSGSKSSKLAMRESIGTAIVTAPSAPRPLVAEAECVFRRQSRWRGQRTASGRRPASRCAQRSSSCRSSNRVASPRNLLTMKPAIIAASSGASAALTPRIWANMPPRSMSPIEHDGAVRGVGEAHIGDVALAQVDLGCAARAFDEHEVGVRPHARVSCRARRS